MPKNDPEKNWLKKHLTSATPISPEIARRVDNIVAQQGRSIGPRTKGNHPVGALDIAGLLTKPLHDLVNFGTGGALDNARTVGAQMRGEVPEAEHTGLLDANNKVTPEARESLSHNLAMLTPGGTAEKKIARTARDIVPEGTQFFDHYSHADLSDGLLQAKYAGTGLPGREAQRVNRPDMMHVYAAGARPEPQFRNMPRYRVAVTNPRGVYDASSDADGIVAKFRKQSQKSGRPFDFDGMEKAIGKAGYAGYHGEDAEVVKLFGDHPVVPHGQRFNIPGERAVADSVASAAPRFKLEFGPNAQILKDAEALRNDPDLYTAAGPKKFRPVADSAAAEAPAFYSRLERAIQSAPMKKGTSAQWLAHLSKNVSSEERDWTGVDKFLKNATGPVTQDQVQQVFDAGKIKLGRTTLGGEVVGDGLPAGYTVKQDADGAWGVFGPDGRSLYADIAGVDAHAGWTTSRSGALRDAREQLGVPRAPSTKFADYTEPGGTNYRENLTTLPGQTDPRIARMRELKTLPQTLDNLEEYQRLSAETRGMMQSDSPTEFRSSHFDEPNILLHTRTKDRIAPDGSKVLHAEEIQSDWHQQGRKAGYAPADFTDQKRASEEARDAAQTRYHEHLDHLVTQSRGKGKGAYDALVDSDPTLPGLRAAYEDAEARVHALRARENGVPDAPFKKTEDWQLLGVKQLIDDAVRGGYDHVAWTPGQMQADRYDLSKQVGTLEYHPKSGGLVAWSPEDNRVVHSGNYAPEALESVIGKEAAEKLLAVPQSANGIHTLRGADLQLGGGGMKSFYDQMLPKNLAKYFKSLNLGDGTPQLGTTEMTFNKPGETSVQQMPSFPITPELRQMVLTKGQPLLTLMGALGLGAGAAGGYGAAGLTQDGTNAPRQ